MRKLDDQFSVIYYMIGAEDAIYFCSLWHLDKIDRVPREKFTFLAHSLFCDLYCVLNVILIIHEWARSGRGSEISDAWSVTGPPDAFRHVHTYDALPDVAVVLKSFLCQKCFFLPREIAIVKLTVYSKR